MYPWYDFENYQFKITATHPRGHWVTNQYNEMPHPISIYKWITGFKACKDNKFLRTFFFSYFSVGLLHHILSLIVYTFRENREFVFISIVQFLMSTKSRMRFGLQIVFVCLYITPSHYHYCANFIWRHWTYKMPFRWNLLSVWVRLSIFSQLSIIQYVGLCVFSLLISFVMIERIYKFCRIIIIKSEVWNITH